MKNKLFFTLFIFPLFANAQSDVVFFQNVNGVVFEIRRIVQSDGSYTETGAVAKDSASSIEGIMSEWVTQTERYQEAAKILQNADRSISFFARQDSLAVSAFGRSAITTLQQRWDAEFLSGAWRQEIEGTITPITFARLSSGANAGRIRFTPQGSTARTVLLFGPMMRVVNWPNTGQTYNLYRIREGLWSDANRKVFLRRV